MTVYDEEQVKEQLESCQNHESKLTDWESRFMSSIGDMVDKGIPLSEKQRDILNNVWERIT